MLDFLGDLGGLFDALKLIGEAAILRFSEFSIKVALMVNIFRPIRGTGQEEENDRVPPGLRRQDSNLTSKTSNTNRTAQSKLSKASERTSEG